MSPMLRRLSGALGRLLTGSPPTDRVLTIGVMARRAPLILALAALIAVGPSGCQSQCGDNDDEPILYTDGTVELTAQGRVYMSTPYDGTWLHFPARRRFLLRHGLGTSSYSVDAYLSFHPRPLEKGGGGLSAPAGNEVIVERLTEDELVVKNDTCSEFYLLVRLEASGAAHEPEAGSAGAGGAP